MWIVIAVLAGIYLLSRNGGSSALPASFPLTPSLSGVPATNAMAPLRSGSGLVSGPSEGFGIVGTSSKAQRDLVGAIRATVETPGFSSTYQAPIPGATWNGYRLFILGYGSLYETGLPGVPPLPGGSQITAPDGRIARITRGGLYWTDAPVG